MVWNKEQQLEALRSTQSQVERLIALLEAMPDCGEADKEACWRFPYTLEAGCVAQGLRDSFTEVTLSLINPVLYILETAGGLNENKTINALARSSVPDALAKEPGLSTSELARRCDLVESRLRPLLRTAARLGLFEETAALSDRWNNTLHSRYFCTDSAVPLRPLHEWSYEYNCHLLHQIPNALKKENEGVTGSELAFGKTPFEFFSDPQNARTMANFNQSMKVLTSYLNDGPLLDFPWLDKFGPDAVMCDVGGGIGAQVLSLGCRFKSMRFVIQDLPHVCRKAEEFWSTQPAELSKRVHIQPHDFFEPQPPSESGVPNPSFFLLRWIIHDWSDSKAEVILRHLRASVHTGFKLILCEYVIGAQIPRYVAQQLVVMPLYGGNERSEEEYCRLLARAGWHLERVWSTRSHLDVVEARAI